MSNQRRTTIETFIYKTVNGCPIHVDIYPAETSGPAPVLVSIHGGALITGTRREITMDGPSLLWEQLGKRGYTQVSIDYRLAPETKLPAIIEDLQDAWRWVHEELPRLFNVDTSRVGVLGRSAGGYLTLMAGFCTEPRPKALVSFYGYGDIMWYQKPTTFDSSAAKHPVTPEEAWAVVSSDPLSESRDGERGPFYLHCRQEGAWIHHVTGLDPLADAAELDAYRPIRNVSPAFPPTLLVHGTADTDVPHDESAAMAAALKAAGVTSELLSFDGVEHVFDFGLTSAVVASDESSAQAQANERAITFLDEWLK